MGPPERLCSPCSSEPQGASCSGYSGAVRRASSSRRQDDPEYIVRLVKQVVTASVETVRLVRELATAVTLDSVIGATLVESQVAAPGD